MPSERFYRLPEEKQRVIRQAAMREFTRAPIDKASINKIIKDADISRGSFYTYFEDKWDVLVSIFENWQNQMQTFCVENVKQHKGNLWLVLEDFLERVLDISSKNDSFDFIRNVMAHSNSEDMFHGFSHHADISDICNDKQNMLEKWIYENSDKSDFRNQDYETFHRVVMLSMSAMAMAMRGFYQGESKARVKEEFAKKLELIRHGACSV